MNATVFLSIATILAVIQYIAHAGLFLTMRPKHGQEEIDLIKKMKSHTWNFSGFQRSYWNFYFGYGLLAILWGFIEVLLLWQFTILSKTSTISVTPFLIILVFANIGHAILTLRYFFLIPAIFDLLITIMLLLAIMW